MADDLRIKAEQLARVLGLVDRQGIDMGEFRLIPRLEAVEMIMALMNSAGVAVWLEAARMAADRHGQAEACYHLVRDFMRRAEEGMR